MLGFQIRQTSTPSSFVYTQAKPMPESMKTKIAKALKAKLEELSILRYVEFGDVKLYSSDFNDTQLPAAQFIAVAELIQHEKATTTKTWSIKLEVIDKPDENGNVSQHDMWNLEYMIARKIWAEPNLNVPGVYHCRYISNTIDLHLMKPFYLLTMDFEVVYKEHLVSDC